MAKSLMGAGSWSIRRFILQQNVEQLEDVIANDECTGEVQWERVTLADSRRKLAQINAAMFGAHRSEGRFGGAFGHAGFSRDAALIHRLVENATQPSLILDPRPGLHIVDINDAYADVAMTARGAVAGQKLFEAFPDNPDDPGADGVSNLYASLMAAAEFARPDTMLVQRYDVRDALGRFVVRYWRPQNTPIFDEQGDLLFLLHQVEDVTEEVVAGAIAGSL